MLTKKEKLLIRPWQMQRYINHRIKVVTAMPAIDFHPPPERIHITQKLKKQQKELERKEKIEQENIRLLQRLGAIMSKKRLDNIWTYTRPNFLSREYIYPVRPKTAPDSSGYHRSSARKIANVTTSPLTKGSKSTRCTACSRTTRSSTQLNQVTPEGRMPWAPQKKTTNRKLLQEAETEQHICCRFCCC
ncbi:AGAP001275-PA-like protein [Anopheles sinensis]|uniref:AGAP001275-PA-like protein n=1 Tax=Anopheles sinensis TaxID=74873 RepID=A0A084W0M2_ANOSI|nr:AGAP001275-PA-like protein [Anopheles sinensis]